MSTPLRLAVLAALALAAAPARAEQKPWSVLSTDYYQLVYQPQHEADARKVKLVLDAGVAALKKEFSGHPVEKLLKVDCKVFLHPKGTGKASEYQVGITTGRSSRGDYTATIDLLAPSEYSAGYRSNVGEPAGDDYIAKLVMHEYSTVLLDRITQARKSGWYFFGAPRWFIDGYEEYLGLTQSTPRNRTEVLAKYLKLHRENPDRIDFEFGIVVTDPYIDGAMLLLFMNETFGKEKVQSILTSEEKRFGKAVTASLGVGLGEFQKRWEAWLKQKLEKR